MKVEKISAKSKIKHQIAKTFRAIFWAKHYRGLTIESKTLTLDGLNAQNCQIINCTFLYSGGSVNLSKSHIKNPKIVLFGPALNAKTLLDLFDNKISENEKIEQIAFFPEGNVFVQLTNGSSKQSVLDRLCRLLSPENQADKLDAIRYRFLRDEASHSWAAWLDYHEGERPKPQQKDNEIDEAIANRTL